MGLILGSTARATEEENGGDTRPVLTAEAALSRLSAGRLHDARVQGVVDLAKLDAQIAKAPQPAAPYLIENVTFQGPVKGAAPVDLHIRDTDFTDLTAPRTVWRHALRLDDVRFNGLVDFRDTRFEKAWECTYCTFADDVMFGGAVFSAPFRLIAASLQADISATFSGARFSKEASFQDTQFPDRAFFQNVLFEADASFVKASGRLMIFIGAQFRGDAEFRSCDFVEARFGLPRGGARDVDSARAVDLVTTFEGFTDFRRCKIGKAVFNDVLMSGPVTFRAAAVGAEGLWLVGATGGDDPLDLRSASFAGPIDLEEAVLSGLLVRWNEVRQGLVQAGTKAPTYHQLARLFRDNGASLDATRAEYEAKRLEWKAWPAKGQDPVAAFAEWWLWTWPTRNGTNILRVLGIAATIWLIVGASLLPVCRRLVFLPSGETGRKDQTLSSQPWNPLSTEQLPAGVYLHGGATRGVMLAFAFAFALLFKLSPWNIRYVGTSFDGSPGPYSIYLFIIWLLGIGLIGIAALTLANLSPPLRAFLPGA